MRTSAICFVIFALLTCAAFAGDQLDIPPRSGVSSIIPTTTVPPHAPSRDYTGEDYLIVSVERPQNETNMAINPANPDHVLGGCNDYRNGDVTAGYFVSFDGGRHWQDGTLPGLDDFDAAGNPTVALDRNGVAYFAGIHFNRNDDYGGLFFCRSDNGGRDWDNLGYIIVHHDDVARPPFEDKPMLMIDQSGGDYDGNLYVSWTRFGTGQIYISRSSDGGESWSDPLQLYGGRAQGSIPVVMPNGDLWVFWIDYSLERIAGVLSVDGGESFGDIVTASDAFRIPLYLRDDDIRVNSVPSATVDRSDGDHRGRIYIAWADIRNDDPDILMVFSDDGENWCDPIRLNDDEFQNGTHQFFPWLAVDAQTGWLSAIWYDRRNDEQNVFMDVYGLHWSGDGDMPPNERVTSDRFDPRDNYFRGRFMGDQIGIIAGGGRSFPTWSGAVERDQNIFGAPYAPGRFPFPTLGGDNEAHVFTVASLLIDGEAPEDEDALILYDAMDNIIGGTMLAGEAPWVFEVTTNWQNGDYNNFTLSIWDESQAELRSCGWYPLSGDVAMTEGGITELSIIAPSDRHEFSLAQGWNLISTNVAPLNRDPWEFFQPWFGEDGFRIITDQNGHFLSPDWDFCNLPLINPLQAYQANVRGERLDIVIEGYRIPPQTPIPLKTGWNYVSYLPDYPLDPWQAFDNILESVIIVQNGSGRFFAPRWDFHNMPNFCSGEGLKVKVSEDCVLIYPPDPEVDQLAIAASSESPEHFNLHQNSPRMMAVLVEAVDSDVRIDEIGALNSSGELVGAVLACDNCPIGMAVWGLDENFEPSFGVQDGEMLTYRGWNKSTGVEFILEPQITEGDGDFHADEFTVLTLVAIGKTSQAPDDFVLLDVSPNPFNSTTTINYSLPVAGSVSLAVYDLSGREVARLVDCVATAGNHQAVWVADGLSSGIYVVKMVAGEMTAMSKVALVK